MDGIKLDKVVHTDSFATLKKGTVTVAYHHINDDIPLGTLKSIKKQSEL